MAIRKVIPPDEERFDLLAQNLKAKSVNFKTTLNISDEMLAMLDTNAAAYHGLRLLKDQFNNTKTAITNFVEELFTGDKKDPLPPSPNLAFVMPTLPAKPGIEQQIREFIEYLEIQDNFTDAIGLELGFYVETGDSVSPEELVGDFKVKDLSEYRLDILFSLQGQDALRLDYRTKGTSAWTELTLTSSPYTLEVAPDPNGLAVTLEMRGTLVRKNKTVGNTSDTKTVVAHA